jgi:hypothetical protein
LPERPCVHAFIPRYQPSIPAGFAEGAEFTLQASLAWGAVSDLSFFAGESLRFPIAVPFMGNNYGTDHVSHGPAGALLSSGGSRRTKVLAMSFPDLSQLRSELEHRVQVRTGRRVRHLAIELLPERVVLRGRTSSYHVKQLAQHGVRDLLPHVPLENVIAVESKVEVRPGLLLT